MKKMKRLLALVLCASIVCTLMFVAAPTASADAASDALALAAAIVTFSGTNNGELTVEVGSDDVTVIVGGSYSGTDTLAIEIKTGVTVEWGADFEFTGTSGNAIELTGDGTFNVSGGLVQATGPYTGTAITNNGEGDVNVSGGLVQATVLYTGIAISNNGGGNVNVSGTAEVSSTGAAAIAIYNTGAGAVKVEGGTVTATDAGGIAISNAGTGAVTISGTAEVTATGDGGVAIRNEAGVDVIVSGTAEVSATNGTAILNEADGDVKVEDNATVSANGAYSHAIANDGNGNVIVSGGTVSANGDYGVAISNTATSTGDITISGGLVQATTGYAINNYGDGAVNVSGSTTVVSVNVGTAIFNSKGTVNVSGGLVQTSTGRAINNFNNGPVNVSGGTIQATTGYAIYNSGGAVNVSGGLVQATTGRAIWNNAGTLSIEGTATVFAYGAEIADVVSGSYGVNDSAIVIAWDTTTGTGRYAEGSEDDITTEVEGNADVTAVWAFGTPETTGIGYTVGSRTGVIALSVTKLATRRPPIFDDVGTTQDTKEEAKDDAKEEPETPATTDPADVDDAPAAADAPFADVSPTAWYAADVEWVYERGLFGGTSATTFAPNSQMTRAMVFTVLARLAGVDTDGGENWYALALEWGVETGLTDGTNPTGNVTREQLVTLLWRYAGSPKVAATLDFADAGTVASWASDAMAWAVSVGIIRGNDNGSLNPQGDATRAEVAAMLRRFVEAA